MLAKLEKKAALQILVYLYEKGEPANREELRGNIKAVMATVYSALEVLKGLDLIEEEEVGAFPFERRVWLREKGMLVARRLAEIENILNTVE